MNPRTPTGQNLKSCTVGQALLPSQSIGLYSGNILKVLKFDGEQEGVLAFVLNVGEYRSNMA